ncbi:MAG: alpha-beta hydrolase superfamily lysophospholipase [Pseudohongiellaceae bacterium]|jgi:alpha-beta hydrolase superfamily lysophospholipase
MCGAIDNALALAACGRGSARVALVGHSLGGAVISQVDAHDFAYRETEQGP